MAANHHPRPGPRPRPVPRPPPPAGEPIEDEIKYVDEDESEDSGEDTRQRGHEREGIHPAQHLFSFLMFFVGTYMICKKWALPFLPLHVLLFFCASFFIIEHRKTNNIRQLACFFCFIQLWKSCRHGFWTYIIGDFVFRVSLLRVKMKTGLCWWVDQHSLESISGWRRCWWSCCWLS